MPYAKAHPFGYKGGNHDKKDPNVPLHCKQSIRTVTTYRVMRRKAVWETDPETGKKKMKLVPVYSGVGKNSKPVYDEFKTVQQSTIKHFGRPRKGRTLAEMVYETFPINEGK